MEFDDAPKNKTRTYFLKWCLSDAAKMEQYATDSRELKSLATMLSSSPRYTYFAHIDAASLQSVISGPLPPESNFDGTGWVNLVDAQWEMPDKDTFDYEGNGMDPDTDGPADEGDEPVEGCRVYDVGS